MVVETDDIHPSIPSMQKAAKEFKAEKERRGRKAGAPSIHASIHPCIYPFCGGRAKAGGRGVAGQEVLFRAKLIFKH